jgi:hypothetical protein
LASSCGRSRSRACVLLLCAARSAGCTGRVVPRQPRELRWSPHLGGGRLLELVQQRKLPGMRCRLLRLGAADADARHWVNSPVLASERALATTCVCSIYRCRLLHPWTAEVAGTGGNCGTGRQLQPSDGGRLPDVTCRRHQRVEALPAASVAPAGPGQRPEDRPGVT